ncbi:hypothetical protein ACFLZW_04880 [Chloroflexota bacterium]
MEKLSKNTAGANNLKPLYRVGGIAVLFAVIVFRRNWSAELTAFKGFGIFSLPERMPANALEWFTLLQDDWFVGLSFLGLFDLVNYALLGLIFLSLYAALREISRSTMLIALIAGLAGCVVYLASNQAFAMLALSESYVAASSAAERSLLQAAGEALLAQGNPAAVHQGTGIYARLLLVLTAGLIISVVMLRSEVFDKWTAIMGILANGIYLLYFPILVFAPAINWLAPTLAAPFRLIWYVLIAIKLFNLGKS